MIAKNHIKHPEALRFQCEMFSNGYRNSPRIMRLIEVIFNWTPTTPQWWTSFKAKASLLSKGLKKMQVDMFSRTGEVVKPEAPMNTIKALIETAKKATLCKPDLKVKTWKNETESYLGSPVYFSYCNNAGKKHSKSWAWGHGKYCAYWGGFSG